MLLLRFHRRLILPALALLAALSPTYGIIVFNNTTDYTDWYKASDTGVLTKGTELIWDQAGAGPQKDIGRSFADTGLSVGQTLRFSYDFTQTDQSVNFLRTGLYATTNAITADGWVGTSASPAGTLGLYSGYYSFFQDNVANNVARSESGNNTDSSNGPLQSGDDIGNTTQQYNINNTGAVTYQVVYAITITSSTQIDTLMTLSRDGSTEMSLTGTETTATPQLGYNAVFIRTSGGTSTFDNMKLEVIPEPTAFALLAGLGCLLLVRLKRKG